MPISSTELSQDMVHDALGEIDGVAILIVDGDEVMLRHDMDFHDAGNWKRYAFIPKGQVWLDDRIDSKDWPYNLYHELYEVRLMEGGLSYDAAHKRANGVERELRERNERAKTLYDFVIKSRQEKGIFSTLQAAGHWFAARWEALEERYGRKAALAMVVASIATFPVPFNITAIIGAAEAIRGIHGYFTREFDGDVRKCRSGKNTGKPGPCPTGITEQSKPTKPAGSIGPLSPGESKIVVDKIKKLPDIWGGSDSNQVGSQLKFDGADNGVSELQNAPNIPMLEDEESDLEEIMIPADVIKRSPVKSLTVDNLYQNQEEVDRDRLEELAQPDGMNDEPIVVANWRGRSYVIDGHHRAALYKIAGRPHITAHVVELNDDGSVKSKAVGKVVTKCQTGTNAGKPGPCPTGVTEPPSDSSPSHKKPFGPMNKLPSRSGSEGSGAEEKPAKVSATQGFHPITRNKDGSYSGGTPEIQKRAKSLRLPPAWTDVQISADPKSELQATGKDVNGRTQYAYSTEHSAKASKEKFARVKDCIKQLPALDAKIRKQAGKSEEAACLLLIRKTGFRVGGEKETGGKVQAYGASTLTGKHVKINGDTLKFDFIGKKGVRIQQTIKDPELAKLLGPRLKKAGSGKIFNTSDSRIRDWFHKNDGHFKPKDFRTVVAADTALKVMGTLPAPKNEAEFKKRRLEVGKRVSQKLGNTPAIALASYVPPEVFAEWKRVSNGGKTEKGFATSVEKGLGWRKIGAEDYESTDGKWKITMMPGWANNYNPGKNEWTLVDKRVGEAVDVFSRLSDAKRWAQEHP